MCYGKTSLGLLHRVSSMHLFSLQTLCNSHLLLTAPPLVHHLTSFSCFSAHRARGECQDGHLPLCSPLQHTNSHQHIPAAGGQGIRNHGGSRYTPHPPPHPGPRPCGCPQSSGEGQEPQDSAPWGFGRPHGSSAARTAVRTVEGEVCVCCVYVCVCVVCMCVCVCACV